MNNTLTALKGVKVGHATHLDKLSGTTVVVFDKPYPVAFKSYGGSTGTFNTDALTNGKSDTLAHAIFISGGSWTGLQAGGEIMKCLIEKKIGYEAFKIINPNVTGAIVFDLGTRIGKFDPLCGREAVDNLSSEPVERGNVGAGTGTSVGKFRNYDNGKIFPGMKAGVGCAKIDLGKGAMVTALSVVNAMGNIVLPDGNILAGNRNMDNPKGFVTFDKFSNAATDKSTNTTISIVGTNVNLHTRENYERVAHLATHGQVRAIDPVNTSLDGDTVFVFSTEEIENLIVPDTANNARKWYWSNLDVDVVGQAAAKAVQESIYDACRQANSIKADWAINGIVPSAKDYK